MNAVKLGVGAVTIGASAWVFKSVVNSGPQPDPTRSVKQSLAYIGFDKQCEAELLRLQNYSHYAKELFDTIARLTNAIMLYSKAFHDGNVPWDVQYRDDAGQCYLEIEDAMDEFIKCCKFWLRDIPIVGYDSLSEKDPDYVRQESKMAARIDSGLKDFTDIAKLKENIIIRLQWHLMKMGVREADAGSSLEHAVEAQPHYDASVGYEASGTPY